jgi:uncharacterized protein YhdP
MTAPGPQQKRVEALMAVAEQSCRTAYVEWDVTVTAGILPNTDKLRAQQILDRLVALLRVRQDENARVEAWNAVIGDELASDYQRTAVSFDEHADQAVAVGNGDEYTVTAKRWDHGWELHIDGEGVTQTRTLANAGQQVRDYLSLLHDDEPDAS